jgi:hypothetical protein
MGRVGVDDIKGYEPTPNVTGAADDHPTTTWVATIRSIVATALTESRSGSPAGIEAAA